MELKVNYTGNIEDMPGEDLRETKKFIDSIRFAAMGTVDDETGVWLAVLTKLKGEEIGEMYFASPLDSEKIRNLRKDPRCEIMFAETDYTAKKGGQVNLSGVMEIFTDLAIKQEKWEDMLSMYFSGPEDQNMCILMFKPETLRAQLM